MDWHSCTDSLFNGCDKTAGDGFILNPIISSRLRTLHTFSFLYGRVEARAKIPSGDWIWPGKFLVKKKHVLKFFQWLNIECRFACKKCDRILMEIPCNSSHKLRAVWCKSTPNSMTIPCHLSRFYLLSMFKHDMDFRQVQVMEFPWHLPRKRWDFHRIWDHFQPN